MFNTLEKLEDEFKNNPFISFDSDGNGISRIFDDKWDFVSRRESTRYVLFHKLPPEHKKNIQSFTAKLSFLEMDQAIDNYVPVAKLLRTKKLLWAITKIWGKSDFSLLSNNIEWLKFKENIKRRMPLGSLKQISTTLRRLSNAGLLNRYIDCKAFNELSNEKKSKQHLSIPTTIYSQLLQQAVEVIEVYHPHRYEISTVMRKTIAHFDNDLLKRIHVHRLDENGAKYFNYTMVKYGNELGKGIPNFRFHLKGEWIKSIVKYCLMVVVMFTGMRSRESRTTNPNSYKVFAGIPMLCGNTYKSNKGVAKKEVWVTHPIALKALELVHEATMYAREHFRNALEENFTEGLISKDEYDRGSEELASSFITTSLSSERYNKVLSGYILSVGSKDFLNLKQLKIKATHEEVEEFNLLNPDWYGELKIGGSLPKLSLHDLRRSFAVFMVRNKLGNIQTIKHQLKHKNINMSNWYANNAELIRSEDLLIDKDLMSEVDKTTQSLAIEAFDDIYNGTQSLSGGGSVRIIEERKKLLGKGETIVLSRDELESLVRNGTKSIVLLPTGGYCTNSSCERVCSIESFVAESKPCQHLIITDKSAKQMAAQRKRLIVAFESLNEMEDYAYSRILIGYTVKIRQLEQTLKSHNIDFEPFIYTIKANHE
ncbi:tyrosine-type recombinase/integrase [Pseudoalteromonas sp. TAE56]|uniref:tyrosine-type recombinase/integrase n=1 Tax=Pseudoalteromonas sp. TAE56 TaxID=1938596 RepID=UPI0003FBEF46|nr:tyrosine-type recombinase/integrase [Pseudoalteromonas sp. TAE56]